MKHCIINTSDKKIIDKMEYLGYVCHSVIESDCVSAPICAHSDVLYKKINNHTVYISRCQRGNKVVLEQMGYNVVFIDNFKPGYENECLLNFIINDDYIIHNPATAISLDEKIIGNRKIIPVKQGYTACSTVCVNNHAYITDDDGIYKTLAANNLDCLKISKGEIRLDGYNYGFIGGASVRLNEKEILFFGDIKNENDKSAIEDFLKKYNMTALYMENEKLTDIGSALIL